MTNGILENPFPGLRPFRDEEEYLFFGRESQVDRMVDKLAATRFLAVVGTSGSGKSSLVSCGLKPALNRGLMASAGTRWQIIQFRPGAKPVHSLAEAWDASIKSTSDLHPEGPSFLQIIEATLQMSSLGLTHLVDFARFPEGTNVLLIVDQFEEIFRYGAASKGSGNTYGVTKEAAALVKLLLEAAALREFPIYIVLTMRSDFLGECSQFDGLPEAINAGQYLIPRMTREERRAAIAGPIEVSGGEISPVLLTRLVNDVGDNPDQLSLLQHAINRTWINWQATTNAQGLISLEHYEAIGTMMHALDLHAEEAYASLKSAEEKEICGRIFKALTDTGTDARGIRRPMSLASLYNVLGSNDFVMPVLELMRGPNCSFLMPPISHKLHPDTMIDISHEILMRVWDRLKVWASEEAESANMYRRLVESAMLHKSGREALWRDPGLEVALEWQTRQKPNIHWAALYRDGYNMGLAFLAASREERDQQRFNQELERKWGRISQGLTMAAWAAFMFSSFKFLNALVLHRDVVGTFLDPADSAVTLTILTKIMKSITSLFRGDEFRTALSLAAGGIFGIALLCLLGYLCVNFVTRRVFLRFAAKQPVVSIVKTSPFITAAPPPPLASTALGGSGTVVENLRYAGFWQRVFAALLDGALLSFFSFIVVLVISVAWEFIATPPLKNEDTLGGLFFCFLFLLGWLYPAIARSGPARGTIADLLFGIAILKRNGRRAGFGTFTGRCFGSLITFFTFFIQPFTPQKRALADMIAGTIVVRRRQRYVDQFIENSGRVSAR
ncbi:nSTAND1 domain-containing NTPase [Granulicella arctica]|uniref:nSTAND1 domain-containing NTPase n=1 Tax=Granulicella arctica TaxID=940613 RepID=UPI0021DF5976|nr:RDD family protein [Granulicella arctica]